jgi:FKBP-type peptidyl-prolyl cis-trans isomerase FkpA
MKSTCYAFAIGLATSLACAPGIALAVSPVAASAPAGLKKLDSVVGSGALAVAGSTVSVHYTGWLYAPKAAQQHGARFDSSRDAGPFTFVLGAGKVIPGWDQGVAGMKVGGKRTLIVPAALGYGARGAGPIPPNANLIFDVELLGAK